ncbi:MAG TPA: hypothetical protein PLB18_23245 [Acidobacteriota bacterium]|nr:hypothetical protein [Acidobacteriota bacterium]
MTLTITLPQELEEKVAKRAAEKGLPIEEYARQVLEKDVELVMLRELFAPVRAQIEAAGTTDEDLDTLIREAVSEVRARS